MNGAAKPKSRARRWVRATSALLGVAWSACVEPSQPTAPSYAFIRVVVAASGGDLDSDGIEIVVDAVPKGVLDEGAREGSFYLPAGAHVVSIDKVAENCTVTGQNLRTVNLVLGQTVTVQFDVVCVPTGVMITTRATGWDIPQAFIVFVDAEPAGAVVANDSLPVSRLTPGEHSVTLRAPEHCTVSSSGQATATVAVATFTEVPFDISCVAVVRREKTAFTDESTPYGPWVALVNPDGSGEVQLHQGAAPAWSPDGRRLAFSHAQCFASGYHGYSSACRGASPSSIPRSGML